ncbi:NAD-dependent epimerase/dehydratase family protein [Liquorilactobacillus satsumensis]|uniref:NADH dehydrogenase n=1 Tax=Liquorilactobacillus satsumensis DSM 16230 = JCM 12392 TaxID=1423801 RepID=A0A0R1V2W0_9LACO|nr:NAD-dependent epimerase/dehydratase family protein [Liquorilactobacillus satsumensis]KRL97779.1 NADH dehydrogenase [Liquorilactobacillus satsumensis DSM 16230 = JCM 12392]MCC7666159.1 NAD(P)-dependent oxidoreductase [Liquorilactobacillus satsumensis]MCP9313378.1 NAD(P)-dependent oxidoreductase [Liquorilactobacillus satsumensis]MCP9329159.1 NAD(P)-dependent oxidoreductase [Liquorilactobacillus satsumensis]MCP9357426.1 NAD(P)-dependent oxidoreductase [Liquorilactobacillus satsumensis]
MKIVLLGGSGFVGQGVIAELLQDSRFEVVSISRSGGNETLWRRWPQVQWVKANLTVAEPAWQQPLKDADWVIDLIGVLFARNYNDYQQKTIRPVTKVLEFLQFEAPTTKWLFVSANAAPKLLHNYLRAKRELERQSKKRLGARAFFVYPGLIYAPERPLVNLSGSILRTPAARKLLPRITQQLRPLKRWEFAQEIKAVLLRHESKLTKRN